jgi:uracil-DNA glycosylase family 4
MENPEIQKHRRTLWLRSERAFGLESVRKVAASEPPAISPQTAVGPELFAPKVESVAAEMPALSRDEKVSLLAQMDVVEVKPCVKCRLCQSRRNTVFGEGDADAKIFFIGEGPGENEDIQGRPFVGRAGELLNKMIAGMGLRREQVFIANIVKCRPPDNRVPAPDEVEACTPYLVRQLEIIRPKVIVTLGLPAAKYMLESRLSMGKLRGQWHNWRGIKLMPTFHPAYLLRSYTEENRAAVWSDLKQVMAEVGLPIPARSRS